MNNSCEKLKTVVAAVENMKVKFDAYIEDDQGLFTTDEKKNLLDPESQTFNEHYTNIMNKAPEIKSSLEKYPEHLARTNSTIEDLEAKIQEIVKCTAKLNDLPNPDNEQQQQPNKTSMLEALNQQRINLNQSLESLKKKKQALEANYSQMSELIEKIPLGPSKAAESDQGSQNKKEVLKHIEQQGRIIASVSGIFNQLSSLASTLKQSFSALSTLISKANHVMGAADQTLIGANNFLSDPKNIKKEQPSCENSPNLK